MFVLFHLCELFSACFSISWKKARHCELFPSVCITILGKSVGERSEWSEQELKGEEKMWQRGVKIRQRKRLQRKKKTADNRLSKETVCNLLKGAILWLLPYLACFLLVLYTRGLTPPLRRTAIWCYNILLKDLVLIWRFLFGSSFTPHPCYCETLKSQRYKYFIV